MFYICLYLICTYRILYRCSIGLRSSYCGGVFDCLGVLCTIHSFEFFAWSFGSLFFWNVNLFIRPILSVLSIKFCLKMSIYVLRSMNPFQKCNLPTPDEPMHPPHHLRPNPMFHCWFQVLGIKLSIVPTPHHLMAIGYEYVILALISESHAITIL